MQSSGRQYYLGVLSWLDRQPAWAIYALSLLLMSGVAYGDWITGPDISFRLFYLLPVFLVTWRSGLMPGALFATFNALAWVVIREDTFNTSGHPALPVWNMLIEIAFFFVVVVLVDKIRRGLILANELSRTDVLTGVANRRHFRTVLEEEVLRARRSGHPVALAYMDLDNFKTVNDSCGHLIGDRVLCATAEAIRTELRQTDLVARLGGDEFAVVLPESNAEGARGLMGRVRDRLAELYRREGWPVTVSIGVVAFHEFPTTTDEIIHAADGLMYTVKYDGKNCLKVMTWSGVMETLEAKAPAAPAAPVAAQAAPTLLPAASEPGAAQIARPGEPRRDSAGLPTATPPAVRVSASGQHIQTML